ncbi:MAG: glycosyltransferase, partial [Chloroflexi bacterium]|nr:glycosyltransferase [Chloroflexota bacterium]
QQAFPSAFPSRSVEKSIERWVLSRAALVLADRRYYREFAVRNGAAPTRAVATRVLADGAYAAARAEPAVRARYGLTDGPLLTYVGRLDADKFPCDLVECLARVRKRFPRAQLACCGTGTLDAELRALAGRLGVGEALHLLGSLALDDLAGLVAASDVVVAAHMGYTLVEAGLTGVPIATYDFDYHGEILEDGVSGMLAPFRDVDDLAERVCALLADPPRARRMGARARQRLLADHSRAAVIPLYQAAYARVLTSR